MSFVSCFETDYGTVYLGPHLAGAFEAAARMKRPWWMPKFLVRWWWPHSADLLDTIEDHERAIRDHAKQCWEDGTTVSYAELTDKGLSFRSDQ